MMVDALGWYVIPAPPFTPTPNPAAKEDEDGAEEGTPPTGTVTFALRDAPDWNVADRIGTGVPLRRGVSLRPPRDELLDSLRPLALALELELKEPNSLGDNDNDGNNPPPPLPPPREPNKDDDRCTLPFPPLTLALPPPPPKIEGSDGVDALAPAPAPEASLLNAAHAGVPSLPIALPMRAGPAGGGGIWVHSTSVSSEGSSSAVWCSLPPSSRCCRPRRAGCEGEGDGEGEWRCRCGGKEERRGGVGGLGCLPLGTGTYGCTTVAVASRSCP
ncbi:hypothetical protein B0H16DRAFT_1539984 [Mycena metata]|uniref:Uncharacterized protein n=1 Tax=Mycena metata TaxID=1033252 RepID=A0AAD7NE26_9AGAR|nr:hypothetical protein B0H16DRAFT_1539984 [Mycena metata]